MVAKTGFTVTDIKFNNAWLRFRTAIMKGLKKAVLKKIPMKFQHTLPIHKLGEKGTILVTTPQ